MFSFVVHAEYEGSDIEGKNTKPAFSVLIMAVDFSTVSFYTAVDYN